MADRSSVILGALLLLLVAQCATAARWVNPLRDGCVPQRRGYRRWTASLVDFGRIGAEGLRQCRTTPADIGGQHFNGANECRKFGRPPHRRITGTFYVRDRTCGRLFTEMAEAEAVVPVKEGVEPVIEEVVAMTEEAAPHWGRFHQDGCTRKRLGYRRWTARLFGVRGGNWNATCLSTPATIRRHRFAHPARCYKGRHGHVIGVFYVHDRRCRRVSDFEEALALEMEAVEFEDAARDLEEASEIELEETVDVENEADAVENVEAVKVETHQALG